MQLSTNPKQNTSTGSAPHAAVDRPLHHGDLAYGLDAPVHRDTAWLAEYVAGLFGPSAVGVIHYGSRAQRSDARPESAHDFFVIVDQYPEAYRSLRSAVHTHYSVSTAVALARVLPPSVISLTAHRPSPDPAAGGEALRGKCAVLSLRDLERLCSPAAKDHFTRGRLFQQVQLVWARDAAARGAVVDALVSARRVTFDWGRAYLPATFDVDAYCRTLLETSFAAEIRPEGLERVSQLLAAQSDTLTRVYGELLQQLAARSLVTPEGNVYRLTAPPGALRRLRMRLWFARSKLRATLRWSKHIALYEGWLDYIVQKIARRTGQQIVLTEREKRWPLIFLWPRAIRFVLSRPQRSAAKGGGR